MTRPSSFDLVGVGIVGLMLAIAAPASDFVEEWDAKNYVTGTLPATKNPSNNGTLSGVARLWQCV